MIRSRRLFLAAPFLLSACAESTPVRTSFPPLTFDYLLKLQLNVATIEEAPPPPQGELAALNPVPVIGALFQMARDRLVAGGNTGKAVFTIEQADISRIPSGLQGDAAVRLDVVAADGTRAGFAEARVTRQQTGGSDLRGDLYDLTRAMLQDMNVEFEYQVRRSLHGWLQETGKEPPPAPVEAQPLSPPTEASAPPRNGAAPAGAGSSGSGSTTRSLP